MEVTPASAIIAARYGDPGGAADDVPARSGDVFLAVAITYRAAGTGASIRLGDWKVTAEGLSACALARVRHGPRPTLQPGALAPGTTATGWVIWEVPGSGRLTLSYAPAGSEVARFVIRPR